MPEPSHSYDQDAEWFVVKEGENWREIRFHDYSAIYDVPGLYEQLFYETLRCDSPRFMSEFLDAELVKAGESGSGLRVFDLGAGNGIMGDELRRRGVEFVVGADILPAAEEAAARDRPGTYRAYHVLDMLNLTEDQRHMLDGYRFNALTCIAALGFGDIPPGCFRTAYNLLETDGWVALTIKEGFLAETDTSGFATMIRESLRDGTFEMLESRTYQHRLATNGDPLHYVGIIGRKRKDLP
ncbi:methyltransferase domain-containing protein [Pseudonocardia spinosispora]|uniref:methyltransferase domain-containing protein n=1 Tax=Pseudonocardia spinosispora TaxID=103441 RepID=UPI0004051000|nr:methyltransferase domain-containing protein [Pseudonocardia spinosispora]